ncbi:MAG: hypothetical protein AAF587_02690 [Bacteroidota bacterium]
MKSFFFLNLCLLLFLPVFAQPPVFLQSLHPHLSYYGNNLWNPGLKVGLEKAISQDKTWVLNSDLGFFHDPGTQLGLFHSYGILKRRTGSKGFHAQLGISPLSVYRSFLSETYEVSSSGAVERVRLPGRTYLAPVLTGGIGSRWQKPPIEAWFLNLHGMILMPYNTFILPLLNVEVGLRFKSF